MTTTTSPKLTSSAADDYTYSMRTSATEQGIMRAVTDDETICQWWTAATSSRRDGDEVQLFMQDKVPFVGFTVEHAAGTGEVVWHVTSCVENDWVGTAPSFSVRPDADGRFFVAFRHVGLRPALECFDMCQAGWNHFMPSLHQFLETGVGRPNEPRDPSA